MTAARNESVYLADILDAIDRIRDYTSAGREAFEASRLIQDAVIRNLEIIGEAARKVSEAMRQSHPEIPWTEIAGTRNRVIHGYFEVNLDIVWLIVEKDLPVLRGQIAPLLSPSASGA